MSEEELIETLRTFENKRVEQLEEPARNIFYAIMKIADERDKYKNIIKEVRELRKQLAFEYYENGLEVGVNVVIEDLDKILDKESK